MSRYTEYKFVETDSEAIMTKLIGAYERITDRTLQPADPDRLFIAWVADVIVKERVKQNYVGNQNIPSSAEGEYLDALGEWIFSLKRKGAQAANCMERFHLTLPQETSIVVPKGTRVSGKSGKLAWATTEDTLIPIGNTYADVMIRCETPGVIGNGYAAGQIDTLIDVDKILYFSHCENITESDGGAEKQTDEEYFKMMQTVGDSYSTAGAEGSYVYWAKSVSSEIGDVKPVCPDIMRKEILTIYRDANAKAFAFMGGDQLDLKTLRVYTEDFSTSLTVDVDYTVSYSNGLIIIALTESGADTEKIAVNVLQRRAGYVYLYALMNDGTIASDTIKRAIYDACSQESVRPLTDCVSVEDPEEMPYNIECTYYISRDTQRSVADIEADAASAVNEYIAWQCAKLGRDINPDKLRALMLKVGVKRMDIASPTFTPLRSGKNNDVPQVAAVGKVTITNGGFEDE